MTQIPETELYVQILSNEVENAVKVVHLPTGISEASGEHRSIVRNKKEALRRLAAKLERR
jgi:protein subunit release factor A